MSKLQALRALLLDFEALYEKHHEIIQDVFGVGDTLENSDVDSVNYRILGIHEAIEGELKKAEVSRFIQNLTEQGKPVPDYLNQLLRDEFE